MTDQAPVYVVGIGASAGGLEALERFFENVPLDTGMAFVVVQHLSPDFRSLMDELLARRTQLPIRLVEDGMLVEPDHVYLIPPKKEMIIAGGRLLLSEREQKQELTLPIDVFFRSLAQDCGKRAVAIVLSGGGSDGSRGIRAVHDAGGLVIVQDTGSAQFDGMPKTARDTNVATWVLAPHEMPHVLVEHKRRAEGSFEPSASPSPPAGVDQLYEMLQAEFGIDFTHYKPSTVTRRIERRLKLARTSDIEEYVDRLRAEKSELDVLYRDLLIGVTRFFRNEQAFEVLEEKILPDLLMKGPKDTPLRVWIAGCATGEEAYSIAIVLHELSQTHGGRPVKIFATDVHPGSLEIAARGVYDAETVASVSPTRLERYFIHRGQDYQVVPDIRQMIVFAQHNVVRDAPFTRVDLISCRNLLIYLQPPAQQKVLGLFHFALNRGGVMFLGPSESPGNLMSDFETVDRHWRVYRKFSDVRMPLDPRINTHSDSRPLMRGPALQQPAPRYSLASLLGTYDTLLDECMPPSLLITERGEIVHTWNGASRYLKRHDGRQGLDILEAVDEELKLVLLGGMKRALKEPSSLVFRNVRIKLDDKDEVLDVSIRAIRAKNAASTLHLLVSLIAPKQTSETRQPAKEIDLGEMSRAQVGALEAELSYTRENLQAAIEELETSNEELQAANEELLASNEELQSTNEELQSVNEELYTVNAEYQRKIAELTELTNDMDNLLASTDVATIFLDSKLNIRKFTPQVSKTFNLLPQDVGRPIESFTHDIDHPGLVDDLRKVLASGEPIEREIHDRRNHIFFLRVLPYRAKGAKGAPSGVVLSLIDVSGLKAAENALFHERYLLDSLLLGVPDAIYFKDARGKIIRANGVMAKRLGLSEPRDAEGKTPFELPNQAAALAAHRQDEVVIRTGAAQHYCLEARDNAWDLVTRLPLFDPAHAIVGVIGIFRDVTDQKKAEEKIQEAVRRRDQFLAMLSHELRNPLGAIVTATALLRAGLSDSERQARMLHILERQSQQMARLLDDLLEASRVTQNKIELKKLPVDLGAITRDAADAIRGLMEDRKIAFQVDIESRPMIVDGDAARLQQIEVNLLSNAAKYTPSGGHVKLSVKRVGHEAEIRVADDGVGIPKEMLDSVFDLFVQSKRTLDRSDGGLGVGLTLVRSLVGMHGGTVSAVSDGEGKGTELIVKLPLGEASSIVAGPTRSRVRVRKGARVVVIEDNADSREMLCELVTLAGFECHGAEDGARGLDLIAKVHPAIAIIDVGLPGIDGFEVARAVRATTETSNVYLIALTGYGQPADRAKAFAAGFDEHMVKPVQPDVLTELLLEAQRPRDSVSLPTTTP